MDAKWKKWVRREEWKIELRFRSSLMLISVVRMVPKAEEIFFIIKSGAPSAKPNS